MKQDPFISKYGIRHAPQRESKFKKFFKDIFILIIAGFIFGTLIGVILIKSADSMEHQRIETLKHSCKYHGYAMNRHYGRDVCPQEFMD